MIEKISSFLILIMALSSLVYAFEVSGEFTVNYTEEEEAPPQSPPSGSGGGLCKKLWVCGPWTECVDLLQYRNCTDANYCGQPYTKIEARECSFPEKPAPKEPKEPEKPTPKEPSVSFKYFLFNLPLWVLLLILLIIIIILYKVIRKKRYKRKAKKELKKEKIKRDKQRIIDLCSKYKLSFVYTKGRFFVGNKNPDFKHKNLPILIDIYNDIYHTKDYEKRREEYYAKHGYKTIFIKYSEINACNWENLCLRKIAKVEGIKLK